MVEIMSTRQSKVSHDRFEHVLQVGINEKTRLAQCDIGDKPGAKKTPKTTKPKKPKGTIAKNKKQAETEVTTDPDVLEAVNQLDQGEQTLSALQVHVYMRKFGLSDEFSKFKKQLLVLSDEDENARIQYLLKSLKEQRVDEDAVDQIIKTRRDEFEDIVSRVHRPTNMEKISTTPKCMTEILMAFKNPMNITILQAVQEKWTEQQVINELTAKEYNDHKSFYENQIRATRTAIEVHDAMNDITSAQFGQPYAQSWCLKNDAIISTGNFHVVKQAKVVIDAKIAGVLEEMRKETNAMSILMKRQDHKKFKSGASQNQIIAITDFTNSSSLADTIKVADPHHSAYIPTEYRDKLSIHFKFYVEFLKRFHNNKSGETREKFKNMNNFLKISRPGSNDHNMSEYVAVQILCDQTAADGINPSQSVARTYVDEFLNVVEKKPTTFDECETQLLKFLELEFDERNENKIINYVKEYIKTVTLCSTCEEYGWYGSSILSLELMNSLCGGIEFDVYFDRGTANSSDYAKQFVAIEEMRSKQETDQREQPSRSGVNRRDDEPVLTNNQLRESNNRAVTDKARSEWTWKEIATTASAGLSLTASAFTLYKKASGNDGSLFRQIVPGLDRLLIGYNTYILGNQVSGFVKAIPFGIGLLYTNFNLYLKAALIKLGWSIGLTGTQGLLLPIPIVLAILFLVVHRRGVARAQSQ